jgi:CHASE2 domain-containing sensor protein
MEPSKRLRETKHAWARIAGACFGMAAALLTATALLFVWGGIPVVFAILAAVVAAVILLAGMLARRRAER